MRQGDKITGFETITYDADFCVVGGGLAGFAAALAAARHGSRVVLMNDRPVLGGNASSEIRVCIRGAQKRNEQETGIVEELALENIYYNQEANFSVWDSIWFGMVKAEKNITLVLNCSCLDAKMEGGRIVSVKGWQTTTQCWVSVSARIFADCSGDSVLAPVTGARWRMGRETRTEFGESITPVKSDNCTMGLTCMLQVRERERKVVFRRPGWANTYTKEDFPYRMEVSKSEKWTGSNFWWMEIGGAADSIRDTESLRDELIRIVYGVWDFIKNSGEVEADNWDIEWIGFLPGKRESRRYEGDYLLRQQDLENGTVFEDIVGYGGWSMDDHHPLGFETKEEPTIYHPVKSPYGIPYRCLYSVNIENLMFAGRNISVTHAACASTRVMATCGILGQAVGTAAAIAVREGLTPRGIYEKRIHELQQQLMEDDCYLPGKRKERNPLMAKVCLSAEAGNVECLTDGVERTLNGEEHLWKAPFGTRIHAVLPGKKKVESIRLIFDSDINRDTWGKELDEYRRYPTKFHVFLHQPPMVMPLTLMKSYEIWVKEEENWRPWKKEEENHLRLVKIPVEREISEVVVIPLEALGSGRSKDIQAGHKGRGGIPVSRYFPEQSNIDCNREAGKTGLSAICENSLKDVCVFCTEIKNS